MFDKGIPMTHITNENIHLPDYLKKLTSNLSYLKTLKITFEK